jgi:hypothetical protein
MINITTLNTKKKFYYPLKKNTLVNLGIMHPHRPLYTSTITKPHPNSNWKNE